MLYIQKICLKKNIKPQSNYTNLCVCIKNLICHDFSNLNCHQILFFFLYHDSKISNDLCVQTLFKEEKKNNVNYKTGI